MLFKIPKEFSVNDWSGVFTVCSKDVNPFTRLIYSFWKRWFSECSFMNSVNGFKKESAQFLAFSLDTHQLFSGFVMALRSDCVIFRSASSAPSAVRVPAVLQRHCWRPRIGYLCLHHVWIPWARGHLAQVRCTSPMPSKHYAFETVGTSQTQGILEYVTRLIMHDSHFTAAWFVFSIFIWLTVQSCLLNLHLIHLRPVSQHSF